MSSQDLTKLAEAILRRLENKKFRSKIEKHKGQIFIFRQEDFEEVVRSYLVVSKVPEREHTRVVKSLSDLYLKKLRAAEQHASKKSKASAEYTLNSILPKLPNYVPGKDKAFIVTSFNSVQSIKNAVGKELEILTNNLLDSSFITGKGNQAGFHIGHGEFGAAVSATRVLAAKAVLEKANSSSLSGIRKAVASYEHKFGIVSTVDAARIISSRGTFKQEYTPILSNQLATENMFDSIGEREALESLKRAVRDEIASLEASEMKGSPSLQDDLEAVILESLMPSKRAKLKGKTKPKSKVSRKSKSGKAKKEFKQKVTRAVGRGSTIRTPKLSKAGPSNVSLSSIMTVINSRLPQQVANNMGTPALNYRTGRFASSVRVTDIGQTPKGYPSIGYTYMRNPYQVFEYPKGSPRLATIHRDPRNIIQQSIRELATGLITQQFFLRRT